jgi:hypothetical protein
MSNLRFLALILITAGFWSIQGQLYASMPDYVLRMAGETYKPEWYANVNPLVVVPVRGRHHPAGAQLEAPELDAGGDGADPHVLLAMASSPTWFHGNLEVFGLSLHPITLMMVVGIAIQGLAECFLSPKWLEFASKQAPRGREGVYLGFAHMNTFFAWVFGFIFSGYLLRAYCPEPTTLPPRCRRSTPWPSPARAPCPRSTSTPTTCGTPTPASACFHSSPWGSSSSSPTGWTGARSLIATSVERPRPSVTESWAATLRAPAAAAGSGPLILPLPPVAAPAPRDPILGSSVSRLSGEPNLRAPVCVPSLQRRALQ